MPTHDSLAGIKSASGILKHIQLNRRASATIVTESLDNLLIRLLTSTLAKSTASFSTMPTPANTGDKDRAYRRRLGDWVDQQWRDKDALISSLVR